VLCSALACVIGWLPAGWSRFCAGSDCRLDHFASQDIGIYIADSLQHTAELIDILRIWPVAFRDRREHAQSSFHRDLTWFHFVRIILPTGGDKSNRLFGRIMAECQSICQI
jgi:hypothetical protein